MDLDVQDLDQMSDDELANRLQSLGFFPGPIVDSTRNVYQRKLLRLINKEEFNTSDAEEQHEATVIKTPVSYVTESFTTDLPMTSSPLTESPLSSSNASSLYMTNSPMAGEPFASPYRYDELRRRPLTRIGNSWGESSSPAFRSVSENMLHKRLTPEKTMPNEASSSLSWSVKLAIVFCVLLFALLVYRNMESGSSNPVPEINMS